MEGIKETTAIGKHLSVEQKDVFDYMGTL